MWPEGMTAKLTTGLAGKREVSEPQGLRRQHDCVSFFSAKGER